MPAVNLNPNNTELRILEIQGSIQGPLGGVVSDNELVVGTQAMRGKAVNCRPMLLISTSNIDEPEVETHGIIKQKLVFSDRPKLVAAKK